MEVEKKKKAALVGLDWVCMYVCGHMYACMLRVKQNGLEMCMERCGRYEDEVVVLSR